MVAGATAAQKKIPTICAVFAGIELLELLRLILVPNFFFDRSSPPRKWMDQQKMQILHRNIFHSNFHPFFDPVDVENTFEAKPTQSLTF